eukprot:CAMPEP_0114974640 /NCGR_PEP_ID=MMETSP0216-20121206/1638_1 /TAXON_ID=223996 /ORGANISM="Protocruzia adherens, Strain Boccale" /LENGTH=158 /DNA_ID=CAMNT_0002335297 /DNA_START=360 /DNA_END=837 /DNA_ORIENTATION=-
MDVYFLAGNMSFFASSFDNTDFGVILQLRRERQGVSGGGLIALLEGHAIIDYLTQMQEDGDHVDMAMTREELGTISSKTLSASDAAVEQELECTICLGELEVGNEVKVLPSCSHYFHKGCIDNWLGIKPYCPNCKRNVRIEMHLTDYVAMNDEDEDET